MIVMLASRSMMLVMMVVAFAVAALSWRRNRPVSLPVVIATVLASGSVVWSLFAGALMYSGLFVHDAPYGQLLRVSSGVSKLFMAASMVMVAWAAGVDES